MKTWSKSETKFLESLLHHNISYPDIAFRMQRTVEEIEQRVKELKESKENPPVSNDPIKQMVKDNVDGMTVAFTQLCKNYEELGNSLMVLAQMYAGEINPEYFAQRLSDMRTLTRSDAELSKEFLKEFVVFPRIQVELQVKQDEEPRATDGT